MYVKIHDSIFGSSIMEEDIETRYIWLCLLAIADFEGFVDETIPALARRFNVSDQSMSKAIQIFLEPDPSSRTKDNDGRRLEPMRESFGWRIINYEKYRDMRNAEDRKEYMRRYMRDYLPKYRRGKAQREGDKQKVYHSLSVNFDKQDKPKQKQKQKQNKNNINTYAQKFAHFWIAYPKKKSKGQAEKAFNAIKPNEQLLETILSSIEQAKTSDEWLKDGGQYIPYPATWLRAKGWEDEFQQGGGEDVFAGLRARYGKTDATVQQETHKGPDRDIFRDIGKRG